MTAPRPTSDVDIVNLALARIGQAPVTNITTPATAVEVLAARHYPMTRRRLLRGPRVFSFAKKYAVLSRDTTVDIPFGNFTSAFLLPADFLRLLTVGDHTVGDVQTSHTYDVVGRHIFTEEESDTDELNVQYIFDETAPANWDAVFVNLMRLELARDMAYGLTLKPSLVQLLDQELRDVRIEAGAIAAQERPPIIISRSAWIARRRGGGGRDTSRNPL